MSEERATVSIVKGDIQETPANYTEQDLGTVRAMIEKSLDLIGGLNRSSVRRKPWSSNPTWLRSPLRPRAARL